MSRDTFDFFKSIEGNQSSIVFSSLGDFKIDAMDFRVRGKIAGENNIRTAEKGFRLVKERHRRGYH